MAAVSWTMLNVEGRHYFVAIVLFTMSRVTLLSLTVTSLVASSAAFSVHHGSPTSRIDSRLMAKTKNKKKKTKAKVGGGGFGRTEQVKSIDVNKGDYSVFPALEPPVAQSLIPSPPQLQETGPLPGEVYDRLDKIYGFPRFNYANDDADESSGMSFDDLISSTPDAASTSKSSSSSMSDLDFANLLATATGDEPTSTTPSTVNSNMDSIAELPQFSEFRVLHVDPLVLAVDDFFTDEECDRYVKLSDNKDEDAPAFETRSKTVGKDRLAKSQRTSTTWFHHYRSVPELMSKASRLLGLDGIDHWEEPQTVRYRRNEKFTWHLDALAPGDESDPSVGGQRLATLLVYLTDLEKSEGGTTIFRDLSTGDTDDEENKMLKV